MLDNLSYEDTLALLIIVVIIAIIAVAGLTSIVDNAIADYYAARGEREAQRILLRMNMNQILTEMADDETDSSWAMLRNAYRESLAQYRELCN
jgi:hypothetical protein